MTLAPDEKETLEELVQGIDDADSLEGHNKYTVQEFMKLYNLTDQEAQDLKKMVQERLQTK